MPARATPRIHFIFILFLLAALLLLGRLFWAQVVHGDTYAELANRQYVTPVGSDFNRGSIFFEDKDGNRVAAATLKTTFVLAINPSKLEAPNEVFNALGNIVEIDRADFFKKAAKAGDPYEMLSRGLPKGVAEAIIELDLVGVEVNEEKVRFYPAGKTAAHTLGFVGFKENERVGRYGVEQYYNDILSRKDNTLYVNFFAELFSKITDSVLRGGRSREGDIVLTIEPSVQLKAEEMLRKLKEEWSGVEQGLIVMNPQTGGIYAFAALPNFDPNDYGDASSATFSNPLTQRVYEMGSIFKPLTLAAAFDASVITPETTYDDKGFVEINSARIENFDGKGRGVVPMQEVLNQSLNTGAMFAQQQLGNALFADYMLKFGIGEETGIEIPGEAYGLVENLKSTRDIEYATASFGQGIATTPIAMTRALAALANDGALPNPHLVKRIEYTWGGKKEYAPDPPSRVLSQEAAEEITRMLVAVVDDALAGGGVALPQHSMAAKTGTAQIANPAGGGYLEGEFLHSFFGYVPAFDPQFFIFLYHLEPQGARYASETLTEPFVDMAKFLIQYYEVPPDR